MVHTHFTASHAIQEEWVPLMSHKSGRRTSLPAYLHMMRGQTEAWRHFLNVYAYHLSSYPWPTTQLIYRATTKLGLQVVWSMWSPEGMSNGFLYFILKIDQRLGLLFSEIILDSGCRNSEELAQPPSLILQLSSSGSDSQRIYLGCEMLRVEQQGICDTRALQR